VPPGLDDPAKIIRQPQILAPPGARPAFNVWCRAEDTPEGTTVQVLQ